MAVITISRQFGAGGRTLGERLAKRLGYHYVNEDMIKRVAQEMGVTSGKIRAFEEADRTRLMKFLDKVIGQDWIDRLLSDKYAPIDEKQYVPKVTAIIQELYEQGNMVIIGRGSQYILRGYENAWHLLLVGDMEQRVRFMMDKYQLTEKAADRAIRRADQIRHGFLCLFSSERSHNDPLCYDLVINMNRVSMDKAEDLVVALVS